MKISKKKLEMLSQKNNEIILVCKNFTNKNIINKFNSLKEEFINCNFSIISYQDNSGYDELISFLPSWIVKINGSQDIVEGDVLITPLRSLIKERLRKVNYVK